MTSILSGGLLAASMLLGQQGDQPKTIVPTPPIVQTTPAPARTGLGWFNREDRPVLNRIQGWFKRDQADAPTTKKFQPQRGTIRETDQPPLYNPTPVPAPTQPNDFPRKLPNPSSQAPTKATPVVKETAAPAQPIQQASVQQAAPAKTKSPILPQLAEKIGRDEKFEWITGQLEIENGNFVLYYATPETIDKYNGRVVLSPQQVDMNKFRRGDLVSVRGQLVQRPAAQGSIPIYRVDHASMIERPKL